MIDRSALTVGMVILLSGLLSPAAAFASVKCQCNNGMLAEAMDADYDDDNANESCNDACSDMGGGRVWKAMLKMEAQCRFPHLRVTHATGDALLILSWAMNQNPATETPK